MTQAGRCGTRIHLAPTRARAAFFSDRPAVTHVLRVAVPGPIRRWFEYLPPEDETAARPPGPGMRVKVPFGASVRTGVVLEAADESEIATGRDGGSIQLREEQPWFHTNPVITTIVTMQRVFEGHKWGVQGTEATYGDCSSMERIHQVVEVDERAGEERDRWTH